MNPFCEAARHWIGPAGHANDLDPLQGLRWNHLRDRRVDLREYPPYTGGSPVPLSVSTIHALAEADLEPDEVCAVGHVLAELVEEQDLRVVLQMARTYGRPEPDDLELIGTAELDSLPALGVISVGDHRWRLELDDDVSCAGPHWSDALLTFETPSRTWTAELTPESPRVRLEIDLHEVEAVTLALYRTRSMRPDWTDLVGALTVPRRLLLRR
ncbi:MAG TPA: hypothetical protein QGF58_09920 [Myxococcota bacterium]|nr:hypothetical protein [Myxococcota bacterium]